MKPKNPTPTLKLVLTGGPRQGETLKFVSRSIIRIGRDAGDIRCKNRVVIEDKFISSEHLVIASIPGKWSVQDEDSTHGTYLNSCRLSPFEPHFLSHNDTIELGASTSILVQLVREDARPRWGGRRRGAGRPGKASQELIVEAVKEVCIGGGDKVKGDLTDGDSEIECGDASIWDVEGKGTEKSWGEQFDWENATLENRFDYFLGLESRMKSENLQDMQLEEDLREADVGEGVVEDKGSLDVVEPDVGEGGVDNKGILVVEKDSQNLESEAAYKESVKGDLTVGDSEKECGEASVQDEEGKGREQWGEPFDWERGTLEDWLAYLGFENRSKSDAYLEEMQLEEDLREAGTSPSPPPVEGEKYEYQVEVSRLMDLIVNCLYSNKEVFLRELISNASDALDKLRFLGVTEPELLKDTGDMDIRIQTDKDNGIITLTDSGIGMTREELIDCLGTIAQSGTAKFLKALKDSKDAGGDNNLICKFGVGFYSAFLVADRVVVSTKSPKSDKQYIWEGEANASSYTIREETDPQNLIPRGTRLTLYLKRDDTGFAHPERVQKLVKSYSQFLSFPIYTWQEKGYTKEIEVDEDPAEAQKSEQDGSTEQKKKTKSVLEKYWDWELTNDTQPLWLRNPKEVSTEEYYEFFKHTFNEYLEPLASSHFTTEGEVEFRSVLFVPSVAATGIDDIVNPKTKNIRLHVKRVFISDDFDGKLFPRYLSFVKGVVDSNDLPLNVFREILQENRIVRIMRKRLVRKAFDMIVGISLSDNRDDYKRFWENFGKFMKLGCIEDRENHKRIAPLLRFFSSQSEEEMISLDEYVENMKPDQKDIYYIAADSLTSAKNTLFLERLAEKDIEVLFLVDPIDEVAVQNLKTYKEKNFVDISKEDLDLGDKNEEKDKEIKQEFGQTCDWIKKRLADKVASVQISNRLSSSPCVLVSGKFGWSANMECLMKSQTVGDMSSMRGRRVLEINPEHLIIKNLSGACRTSPDDEDALLRAIDILYDTALVSSGYTPENPAQFGGKIYDMMGMALSGKWPASEEVHQSASPPRHNVHAETLEAEVVEPVASEDQKWSSHHANKCISPLQLEFEATI